MNDKEKKFCNEYLKSFNATSAARNAGYSSKTARQIGSRLLSKKEIQFYLSKVLNENQKELDTDLEKILKELRDIAYQNITDIVKDGKIKIDKKNGGLIQSYYETKEGIRVRTWSKIDAIRMIGEYLKIFEGKVPEELKEIIIKIV